MLGLLATNFKPLANDKTPQKERLVIKLGTRYEPMKISKEYCSLLLEYLHSFADKMWDEKEGHYLTPSFEIVAVPEGRALGTALLGLYED